MNNAILITRHRQWRAWQFARRHSRGVSGSSGGGGIEPDDTPNWVYILVVGYVLVWLVMMFVWPTAATYMLTALIWLGIIGWILKIFF